MNRSAERPTLDRLRRDRGEIFYVEQVQAVLTDQAYHIGFEVKSQAKGDTAGSRSTIEEAATQVCRATNGLLEFYLRDVTLLKEVNELWFLPVVFTTAKLWTSETNLEDTELSSGLLPTAEAKLASAKWLLYQYHISLGRKHETRYQPRTADLG